MDPEIKDNIKWLHDEIEKIIARQERMDKQLDVIQTHLHELRSEKKGAGVLEGFD